MGTSGTDSGFWLCLTHRAQAPGIWLPASGFSPPQGVSSPLPSGHFLSTASESFAWLHLSPESSAACGLKRYHCFLMLVFLLSETLQPPCPLQDLTLHREGNSWAQTSVLFPLPCPHCSGGEGTSQGIPEKNVL